MLVNNTLCLWKGWIDVLELWGDLKFFSNFRHIDIVFWRNDFIFAITEWNPVILSHKKRRFLVLLFWTTNWQNRYPANSLNPHIRFSFRFAYHWEAAVKALAMKCITFQSILLAMMAWEYLFYSEQGIVKRPKSLFPIHERISSCRSVATCTCKPQVSPTAALNPSKLNEMLRD